MKFYHRLAGLLCMLAIGSTASAVVSPDRTRLIFNASDKSVSMRLTNQSKSDPYLAQSWIEDSSGKKTRSFISVLPPMQRIEPGEQAQVRMMALAELSQLPQDRETLFFYNVREIPPKAQGNNVIQIAMQSRLKLFYRPGNVELKSGDVVPVQKAVVSRTAKGMRIDNPTPYHLTIGYIGTNGKTLMPGAESVMVAPFSHAEQQLKNLPAQFQIGFVTDYGGLAMFKISCNAVETACQNTPVQRG